MGLVNFRLKITSPLAVLFRSMRFKPLNGPMTLKGRHVAYRQVHNLSLDTIKKQEKLLQSK